MKVALLNRDDMGDGLNRADLRSGNDMIVLFQRPKNIEKDAVAEDGATHHAFVVDREDFELAKEKMKEWGVKIHNVPSVDRPSGSGFYFFDPDGNLLQLYAPPKGASAPVKPPVASERLTQAWVLGSGNRTAFILCHGAEIDSVHPSRG